MTSPADPPDARRRWVVLAVGLLGMIAGCAAQYGLPFLIPAFQANGLSLETAGLLVTAPIVGVMLGLIPWGAAADRWGERRTLAIGLLATSAVLGLGAALAPPTPVLWFLLMVAGATSAAIHAATGRLILGSFPADLRGRAMAVRQTGQPLGVAAAAVVLPGLAESSLAAPYAALAGGCLVAGLLVILLVRDPARPPLARGAPTGAPYRNWFLWRVHAASGLLIVPQWTIAVFAFEFLVGVRGWTIGAAGALLAITQLGGAAARLGAGVWSDRVRHRLGPMRAVALAIAAAMAILGVTALAESDLAVAALVAASILTVSPNGLAYTAVAERAGSAWAGRALGIQNTVQNLVGAVTGPALAAILVAGGAGAAAYGGTFAAIAVVPVVAALAIPVSAEPRAPARASPTGA